MNNIKIYAAKILIALRYRYEKVIGYYNSMIINNPSGKAFVSGKVSLQYPQNITIGKNTYINGGQICASPNAYIKIGENCLISYEVHMRTDMHLYKNSSVLIREQGHREADIIIGNDVWIGYGVQIFGGVTLGDGCVVGAGTIVTKSIMPYQVVVSRGGIRVIGERSQYFGDKAAFK